MRAAAYFRVAYRPLFGAPLDPRLVAAFEQESGAFGRAAPLLEPPVEPVEIPDEGTTLPGLFVRAGNGRGKTLICTNGYDSTIYQMAATLAPAVQRGYHLLLFDGPGQGRALIRQGLVMRPDWEAVVRPVVDYALGRPEVDPARVALLGWSFGGYLAPRAASGEHRLAALIADPGLWSLFEAFTVRFPLPEAVRRRLPSMDAGSVQALFESALQHPVVRWTLQQRGLWVHGVGTLAEYLRLTTEYSMEAVAGQIRCPTLLTQAASDPLAGTAPRLFEALTCPKRLLRFTDAEGAGEHVEAGNRPLFEQRAFDWLDDVLDGPQ